MVWLFGRPFLRAASAGCGSAASDDLRRQLGISSTSTLQQCFNAPPSQRPSPPQQQQPPPQRPQSPLSDGTPEAPWRIGFKLVSPGKSACDSPRASLHRPPVNVPLTHPLSTLYPQVERAAGYIALLPLYPNLRLWLLPQTATGGLAAARSALICATAGRGPVLLMDDDARCWARTVSNPACVKGMSSEPLTFEQLVARLTSAASLRPAAKVVHVGIQHLYQHAAISSSPHAVTAGLQHLSFQPMLVRLPAPVPPELYLRWSHVEDDEFVWRVFRRYGQDAVLKLRYVICSFDVGVMGGGMQGSGTAAALSASHARQRREGEEVMLAYPGHFAWVTSTSDLSSRIGTARVRVVVSQESVARVLVEGQPAGQVIERNVNSM